MLQHLLLTDNDVEKIRDVALSTLETAGMMFQSEAFLKALEAKGASIDWPAERALIPRSLVVDVIETERQSNVGQTPAEPTFPRPGQPGIGTQVAQLLYDHDLKRNREGTRDDFIRLVKFGNALHQERGVGHVVIQRDTPQPLEPLVSQALLIEYAHKPSSSYYYHVEQLDYAAEMGEIYCGDRRRFCGGGVFLTSPLRLCKRACKLMAKRIEMGFPAGAGTMPVAGASVPATMAGAIAVTAAEILGVWTAYRALREDVPVNGGVAAGATDMRSGAVSFCSPEAMLLDFGVCEFFRRLCGKQMGVGGASDYCDAKLPGLRAAQEKAHKAMTTALFTGVHPGVGQGMIDSGKILSPEQLLIERDYCAGVQRLFKPVRTDEDTLALDAILEVGQGLTTTHLASEHTLTHFREALWAATFNDYAALKDGRIDFTREGAVVDQAHQLYLDTLSDYEQPDGDDGKLREIHKVIARARQAMDDWDIS